MNFYGLKDNLGLLASSSFLFFQCINNRVRIYVEYSWDVAYAWAIYGHFKYANFTSGSQAMIFVVCLDCCTWTFFVSSSISLYFVGSFAEFYNLCAPARGTLYRH